LPDTHPYDADFHAWALDQAASLRRLAAERSSLPLDLEHLAEEVEGLANNDLDVVEGLLVQILVHLLRLEWSLEAQPRGHWRSDIVTWRGTIERRLRRSPSVRARIDLDPLYATAVAAVSRLLPTAEAEAMVTARRSSRPWTLDEILSPDWFPESSRAADEQAP
jgi:hypothetical protein